MFVNEVYAVGFHFKRNDLSFEQVCYFDIFVVKWTIAVQVLSDPVQRMIYDEIHGHALTAINPFIDDSGPKDHAFVDEFSCIGMFEFYFFLLIWIKLWCQVTTLLILAVSWDIILSLLIAASASFPLCEICSKLWFSLGLKFLIYTERDLNLLSETNNRGVNILVHGSHGCC